MSVRTRLRRVTRRALACVAAYALFGCSLSPGGPEYTELGLRVEDGSSFVLEGICTPLPVLPGGTVVRDVTLAPELSAHILAVRDSVEVTLHGVQDAAGAHRLFTQEQLYGGLAETLSVTTETGVHYSVVFDAPCTAADSSAGK
jgi:hypothetical protein